MHPLPTIRLANRDFCFHVLGFAINLKLCSSSLRIQQAKAFSEVAVLLTLFLSKSSVFLVVLYLSSEMAGITSILSLRNLFVLSLALNVSLILRVVYVSEKQGPLDFCTENQRAPLMAGSGSGSELDVNHRTSPSLLTFSSSATTPSEVEDDGKRVINLDQ